MEQTRKVYATSLRKYVEFLALEQKDISLANDARLIESKIIDFIISLKEKGMSHSAIHNYLSCIVSFYKINDIILNTKKIGKFMPQQNRVKKDSEGLRAGLKQYLAIDPKYDMLLTSLRTAYAEELNLKKVVTSYDDLLDSLRLSLYGYQIKYNCKTGSQKNVGFRYIVV